MPRLTYASVDQTILDTLTPPKKSYWILVTGYWILDTGYWLLVTGCWLLDAGYWMLVTGCWLLEVPKGSRSRLLNSLLVELLIK